MSPVSKYGVIAEFPSEKRGEMWEELVAKSGGVCQLCEDPIDTTSDDIIIEHRDGKLGTVIPNLYLAHRTCNSSKRDLSYLQAKSMIKFKKLDCTPMIGQKGLGGSGGVVLYSVD